VVIRLKGKGGRKLLFTHASDEIQETRIGNQTCGDA